MWLELKMLQRHRVTVPYYSQTDKISSVKEGHGVKIQGDTTIMCPACINN